MPVKYDFDRLDWGGFEQLVAALLKSRIDLRIESWSGPGDHGRDAYWPHELATAPGLAPQPGPWLFQVKFCTTRGRSKEEADMALVRAISAEMHQMEKRLRSDPSMAPRNYVLVTNLRVVPAFRDALHNAMAKLVPDCRTHVWGQEDVAGLLDAAPHVRSSFPELLGIQDLSALLHQALAKQPRLRAKTALDLARPELSTFVPTRVYHQAAATLEQHNFVVLDGPPEAGKTTIANVLALQYATEGWEAVDAKSPDDFFAAYNEGAQQVFVVDDAFGKTEFQADLAVPWERQFHLVVTRLDAQHRLIWTCRRHIFERALAHIELHPHMADLPRLRRVVVDASRLDEGEKALMLYRHAMAANLSQPIRAIVRDTAFEVIEDPDFTPFRIGRLFRDVLSAASVTSLSSAEARALVLKAIKDPHEGTRNTFRRLPLEHRVALSLLLSQLTLHETHWYELLQEAMPQIGRARFEEILSEVDGAFIRKLEKAWETENPERTWIHPSYGDIVAAELVRDADLFAAYIAVAHLRHIEAFLPVASRAGDNALPAISLDRFRARLLELAPQCGWQSYSVHGFLGREWNALNPTLKKALEVTYAKAFDLGVQSLAKPDDEDDIFLADPETVQDLIRSSCQLGRDPPWGPLREVWDDVTGAVRDFARGPLHNAEDAWTLASRLGVLSALLKLPRLPSDFDPPRDQAVKAAKTCLKRLATWGERLEYPEDKGEMEELENEVGWIASLVEAMQAGEELGEVYHYANDVLGEEAYELGMMVDRGNHSPPADDESAPRLPLPAGVLLGSL